MTLRRVMTAITAAVLVVAFRLHTLSVDQAHLAEARRRIADGVMRLTILGDSVAHGAGDESGSGISGDLDRILRDRGIAFVPTLNLGINGARTYAIENLLRLRSTVTEIRLCDAVIVSIGGNDLFGDRVSQWRSFLLPALAMRRALDHVDRIVAQIHRANPAARVYLLGLYNPYRNSSVAHSLDRQIAMWDSRLIAHFADRSNVDVVRIADLFAFTPRLSSFDHFHPGQEGYALIAQRIAATWDMR